MTNILVFTFLKTGSSATDIMIVDCARREIQMKEGKTKAKAKLALPSQSAAPAKTGLASPPSSGKFFKWLYSILLVSYFFLSGALDSSALHLSHLLTSPAPHITIILIPPILKNIKT